MTRAEFKAAYSPKKVAPVKQVYALQVWREDGHYPISNALATYKSRAVAERAEKARYAAGQPVVVRSYVVES